MNILARLGLDRAWRGPAIPLLVGVFFVMAGMGMVWSVLAVYAESLGASATMVGAMFACFGGIRLVVVNVPAGIVSERLGRRRMMIVGLVVLAAGSLGAGIDKGIVTLFVCLMVQGIGSSIFVTAALSAIADLGTRESRMADMAAYQAATMVGLSLGPGLGGLIAAGLGYGAPFLVQGAMALVAMVPLWRFNPPVRDAASAALPAPHAANPGGFVARAIGLLVITYAVFFVRVAGNWVLLPLVAQQQFRLGIGTIGLMLTAGAIANLAALPLTTWVARKFGRLFAVIMASAGTIAALMLLSSANSVPLAWIAAVLLGASTGLAAPTLTAYAADIAPPGRLGAAMGLLRTMTDIAIVTGPVVAGFFVDNLGAGYQGGLIACAILLLVATAWFTLAVRHRTPPA